MTLTSVGYPGRLTVRDFARIVAAGFGSVFGPDDLKVTTAAGTRLLSVAAGSYAGQGVRDTNSAPFIVPDIGGGQSALPNPSTGKFRWDCVVLHRHWEVGAYDSDLRVVQGVEALNPEPAYPAGLLTAPSDIGTDHDVPLRLVKFESGKTDPVDSIDVRPFAGGPHGVTLLDPRAPLPLWALPGQTVDRAGELWTRTSSVSVPWRVDRPLVTQWHVGRAETATQPAGSPGSGVQGLQMLILNAPAGTYNVTGTLLANLVSVPTGTIDDLTLFLRGNGDSGPGVSDLASIGADRKTQCRIQRTFNHTGGNLSFSLAATRAIGHPTQVWAQSTILATWLSPLPS